MPRILLDLRMVRGRLHGIARYALELARALPPLLPQDWELVGLTGPDGLEGDLGRLRPDIPLQRCAAGFLSPLEQPLLAAALFASRCDLFHATSFSLPALWPGRLVATLHDANHLALSGEFGPGRTAYYRLIVGPRARFAKALVSPSEFSRSELSRHLGLNPYRIQVIPEGVSEPFHPSSPSEIERFRREHRLPPRYLLAVGNPKPYKNLRLLASIAPALTAPIALLAGEGIKARCGFPDSTVELPALPEGELPLLYAGAAALLLPSRYEGFGLPALEAMACGCPVIAARAGALPEVVADAGLLVDPEDASAWTDAALRVLRDPELGRRLADAGLARAARYTWRECALRTRVVYERALER